MFVEGTCGVERFLRIAFAVDAFTKSDSGVCLRLLSSNSLTARVTGNRGARPEGNGSTKHLMQMTGRRAARESFLAPNNCSTVFPSFARKGAWDPDVLCDLGPRCSASG
uniref:Uncharacterized protein n=1 Tax=Toxoplasma gondii COUG TaxID=1074873 RepID=A0A2G8Y6K3_TOXGO|nr:hypothetical protein TGCOUG_392420 [Toxoplasma gondii COUG]